MRPIAGSDIALVGVEKVESAQFEDSTNILLENLGSVSCRFAP
jgi:hypothetical protein